MTRSKPLTDDGEGERLLFLPVRCLGVGDRSEMFFGREMSLYHVCRRYWGTVATEGEGSVEYVRYTGGAVPGGCYGRSVDLILHQICKKCMREEVINRIVDWMNESLASKRCSFSMLG